ncbi:MAG: hypothetical protein EHM61_17625 [Acidobacteria bacterium]|nr:MAG: hypothetical protein EHM61_17625 [Acidobacteriota bacterium]
MSCQKAQWSVLFCFIVSVFADAPETVLNPDPSQAPRSRFFCEQSFVNFAWGYVHKGIYVDDKGGVYRFAYRPGSKPWQPERGDAPTAQELEEKYSHGRELITTVSAEQLETVRRWIEDARKGQLSDPRHTAFDAGSVLTCCYVFDDSTSRYSLLVLKQEGDYTRENGSPGAVKLTRWLTSLTATSR